MSNHVSAELYKAAAAEPSFVAHVTALIEQYWTLRPPTAIPSNEVALGARPEFDLSTHASRRAALKQARVENSRVSFLQETPKTGQSGILYDCYKAARDLHEAAALGCDAARQRWDLDHGFLVLHREWTDISTPATTTLLSVVPPEDVELYGIVPEWVTLRLKLLLKKGDRSNLDNWRGIMLIDCLAKVYCVIVDRRLGKILSEERLEEQCGFSGGRGVTDGTFSLKLALKRRREHGKHSYVLFVDLIKAFDSTPRDVLFTLLKKIGVPPRMLDVIKRMHQAVVVSTMVGDIKVTVPNEGGVKQGENSAPKYFLTVVQAIIEVYKDKYPAAQFEFRCNTRQGGDRAGRVAGARSENVGEFSFVFFLSLYADDVANGVETRAELEAIANELQATFIEFGLAIHVGHNGGASKTVAMFIPAHGCSAQDGDKSNVTLNSGGTVGFVDKFLYLGSWLASDLSDRSDVTHRINKASGAFGALRKELFGTKYASYEAKQKAYTGIILNVLLYGCESWCLTADLVGTLASWHHARLREMCRVTMHQVWIHRITTDELYERIGVQSIEYYIRVRTLRWVGHVARMDKTRLPRRLLTAWVANSRPIGGTEMTYGRSLERWLKHADLPTDFSEWSKLAQDRPKWRALITAV